MQKTIGKNGRNNEGTMNVCRGLLAGMIAAVSACVAAVLLIAAMVSLNWLLQGSTSWDREYDVGVSLQRLSFVCGPIALYTGLAGWVAYTPRSIHSFTKTLPMIFVGGITVTLLIASMNLTPVRYKGDTHPLFYTSELLIAVLPPLLVACLLVLRRTVFTTDQPPV